MATKEKKSKAQNVIHIGIRISPKLQKNIEKVLMADETVSVFVRKAICSRVSFLLEYKKKKKELKSSINDPDKHQATSLLVEQAKFQTRVEAEPNIDDDELPF